MGTYVHGVFPVFDPENTDPLVKLSVIQKSRFGKHEYMDSPQRNGEMWLKRGTLKIEIMKVREKKGREGGREGWTEEWRAGGKHDGGEEERGNYGRENVEWRPWDSLPTLMSIKTH